MSELTILDCTLRDGGYYTNWEFSDEFVQDLVPAASKAGVDIIELGYKSPKEGGTYKNCYEEKIRSLELKRFATTSLAFMIDLKEFVGADLQLDVSLLDKTIPLRRNSVFSYCRIATHVNKIPATLDAIEHLFNMGYHVIVNIMGISLLSDDKVADAAERLGKQGIEALYFADSLGNLTPSRTRHLAEILLQKSEAPIGFHAHENQGLSLANALAAREAGVTFVDATALGMGRGAGNARLEQLLLYLEQEDDTYGSEYLIPVIEKHLTPLLQRYQWGWRYDYMLTGQNDIHPMYAQTLSQEYDLTIDQRTDIINSLEFNNDVPSSKFSKEVMVQAVKKSRALELKAAVVIPARFQSSRFPGKPLVKIGGVPMIVRVCRIAEKAVGRENVYVATDNADIAKTVADNGFPFILTGEAATGTDRIAQAIEHIDADIIVNVQGDEPLLNPDDITKIIETKKKYMHEIVNGMCPLGSEDNPDSVTIPKVVATDDGKLIYMSREPVPGWKVFREKAKRIYWKQVCIYAFTKNELELYAKTERGVVEKNEDIEILRFLEIGYPVRMVKTSENSVAVDVPEDVQKVERALSEKDN